MRTYLICLVLLAFHIGTLGQTNYPNGLSGCVARWSFCSNGPITSLPDVSGNGNNGTVFNLTAATGFRNIANTAMAFDGSTSYAVVNHSPSLTPQSITMIALVKFNGWYTGSCELNQILSKGYPYFIPGHYALGAGDNQFDNTCGIHSPNNISTDVELANLISASYSVGNNYQLNQWYFIAATYEPNNLRIYKVAMNPANHVNNITVAHNVTTNNGSLGTNSQNLSIGNHLNPTHPYWFNGEMDEIALFDRALSQSEIQSVYDYLWQVITIGTLPSSICAGGSFNLNYTVNAPSYFLSGNTFTAQLSDANGSFATPVNIGTVSATTSGTIPCVIPASTPLGAGYRIRIASSNSPHITDGEVCQPITISVTGGSNASINIYPSPNDTICNNEMAIFTAVPTNLGTSPQLQWIKNGQPISGANSTTYQTSNIVTGDVFTCEAVNTSSCPNPPTVISNNILMTITQPAPAHVNIIANPGLTISPWQSVTFTATSVMAGSNPVYHWFKNGQPITGVTSNTLTVNNLWDNDTISVVLYSSDPCASPATAASNDLIIRVKTGIAGVTENKTRIYPNPNTGDFYIEAPTGSENVEVTIANSVGQVIYYKNVSTENGFLRKRITLDEHITNGIYMLRITTDSMVENVRFAVER